MSGVQAFETCIGNRAPFVQATRASRSVQIRAAQSNDEGLDVEQLVKDLQDRVRVARDARTPKTYTLDRELTDAVCCSGIE